MSTPVLPGRSVPGPTFRFPCRESTATDNPAIRAVCTAVTAQAQFMCHEFCPTRSVFGACFQSEVQLETPDASAGYGQFPCPISGYAYSLRMEE